MNRAGQTEVLGMALTVRPERPRAVDHSARTVTRSAVVSTDDE